MSGSTQRRSFVRGRKRKFGAEQVHCLPWTYDFTGLCCLGRVKLILQRDTLGLLNSTVKRLQLGQNKTGLIQFTWMKECKCLKMLLVIQHVLLEHEVSTDQVLRPVLHSATGQPVRVWSVPTGTPGTAFQHVGLEEVNDVEDQTKMRENLFVPLRRCIKLKLVLL